MRLLALLAVAASLGAAGCAAERINALRADVVAQRLDKGVAVDAIYGNQTYLMIAAEVGNIETVRLLLSRGASPFIRDNKGRTAHDWAVLKNYQDIAQVLKEAENNPSMAQRSALTSKPAPIPTKVDLDDAIRRGDLTAIEAGLAASDYRTNSHYASLACSANQPEALKLLVEKGSSLDFHTSIAGKIMGTQTSPLRDCVSNDRPEMTSYLLSKGATIYQADLSRAKKHPRILAILKAEISRLESAAARAAESPRQPGNLDDAAYDRMRAAAGMPPEKITPVSDVDSPSRRVPARPDDFALVIGIEKYSRLPEAAFAENDADAMKKHLLALGYPERNIILLKGGQATRGAISGYVEEWLPRNTKAGSRVFVYFSGHGSPDAKSGDAYLVPWDGDAMFLKSTAYPLKSLYASLAKLKAKRVLVALDSCFSGAGGRSVLAEGARPLVTRTEEFTAPAGLTVLSAASGDEITATIKEQGHGVFTYYLLKAFNNGKLTARAAYDELKPLVQDEAHRQNREQTPLLLGDDTPF